LKKINSVIFSSTLLVLNEREIEKWAGILNFDHPPFSFYLVSYRMFVIVDARVEHY
jgi:hypothetical protein